MGMEYGKRWASSTARVGLVACNAEQAAALMLQDLLPQAQIDFLAMVEKRSDLEDGLQPEL